MKKSVNFWSTKRQCYKKKWKHSLISNGSLSKQPIIGFSHFYTFRSTSGYEFHTLILLALLCYSLSYLTHSLILLTLLSYFTLISAFIRPFYIPLTTEQKIVIVTKQMHNNPAIEIASVGPKPGLMGNG